MNDPLPLLAVLLSAVALSWWYRKRTGRLQPAGVAAGPPSLVLFTLSGCGLCLQARRVVDEVAGPRLAQISTVDMAAVPDRAARAAVRRAPTTLIVGPDGIELGRISGVPDARQLATALDRAGSHPA